MIAEIKTGSTMSGLQRYHDMKVDNNVAHYIGIRNLISLKSSTKTFEMLAGKNHKVAEPVYHVSLNLPPGENIDDEVFLNIADRYMELMGFHDQPYYVVRHNDKKHEHVHIISTRIGWDGKKINDSFEKYRSQKASKVIEEEFNLQKVLHVPKIKQKGLTIEQHFRLQNEPDYVVECIRKQVSRLNTSNGSVSIQEYKDKLKDYNISFQEHKGKGKYGDEINGLIYFIIDDKGERIGKGIPSTQLQVGADNVSLNALFEKNKSIKRSNASLHKSHFKKLFDSYQFLSQKQFENFIKRNGLEVQYHKNSGGIYGVSFIDGKTNISYKGSELGVSWNKLSELLTRDTTIAKGKERNVVDNEYRKLRAENLGQHFFEYQFLEANYSSLTSLLSKRFEDVKVQRYIHPMVQDVSIKKVGAIDIIKEREYKNFSNQFSDVVSKQLDEKDSIKSAILLNSFYIKRSTIGEGRGKGYIFHHARSDEFILNSEKLILLKTNDYSRANRSVITNLDLSSRRRNLVRDSIISIHTGNFIKMPLEMFYPGKYAYEKNLLNYTVSNINQEEFSSLASKAYAWHTFKQYKGNLSTETLLYELAIRGISIIDTDGMIKLENCKTGDTVELASTDQKWLKTRLDKVDINKMNDLLRPLAASLSMEEIVSISKGSHGISLPGNEAINELGIDYAIGEFNSQRGNIQAPDEQESKFAKDIKKTTSDFGMRTKAQNIMGVTPNIVPSIGDFSGNEGNDAEYHRNEMELKKKRRRRKKRK